MSRTWTISELSGVRTARDYESLVAVDRNETTMNQRTDCVSPSLVDVPHSRCGMVIMINVVLLPAGLEGGTRNSRIMANCTKLL